MSENNEVVERGEEEVRIGAVRKIIAERMHQSLSEMAQGNHRINVDMSGAVALREKYKANGIKISYNDIVIKCVAKALMEFPEINCRMNEKTMTLYHYVNMGMAVDTPRGLLVPVIKNADLLTLPEISAESARVAAAAKSGRLALEDRTGATFTISNLGMFDIDDFTALINPPEAGIIAVGKMNKTPVVVDDEIVIRPIMQVSLSYDHRVVDGAPAARFLQKVKNYLQDPSWIDG